MNGVAVNCDGYFWSRSRFGEKRSKGTPKLRGQEVETDQPRRFRGSGQRGNNKTKRMC